MFVVGMAAGGQITIWVNAIKRNLEVFSEIAEEIEGNWNWIVDNPDITREDYIKLVMEEVLKPLENKAQHLKQEIAFGR